MSATYIRWRKAMAVQGYSRDALPCKFTSFASSNSRKADRPSRRPLVVPALRRLDRSRLLNSRHPLQRLLRLPHRRLVNSRLVRLPLSPSLQAYTLLHSLFAYGSPLLCIFVFIARKSTHRVPFVKPENADLVSGLAEIAAHEDSLDLSEQEKVGWTRWQRIRSWIL